MELTAMFCKFDDFSNEFETQLGPKLLTYNGHLRNRRGKMSLSERMTILTLFHQPNFRNFKHFYNNYVKVYLKKYFPYLLSYERFVALIPSMIMPLTAFMYSQRGKCTGISFIDSTKLPVCTNTRIERNKVFKGVAKRGKSSTGWFYGFKLHIAVNDKGEILAFAITSGNVDDRVPVDKMTNNVFGKLFGDKGYISQKLFDQLMCKGIKLITTLKGNMKKKILPLKDKILLRKRYIIETINDQLKNISQIDHTRHRSVYGFIGNLLTGLIAYSFQEKKPSIKLYDNKSQLVVI